MHLQKHRPVQRLHGFTIVELLIVIVVIAILAAITIVAYNGIQSRARNAQQLTAAKGYMTAFASYVAANGSYPPYSTNRACLGVDQSNCVDNTSWVRDATIETALKTIASSLPAPSTSLSLSSSPKMGYIPINTGVNLDAASSAFLIYTIEPPGTCSTGTPASGVWPDFTSTAPAQGYTQISGSGNMRVCVIPLPKA